MNNRFTRLASAFVATLACSALATAQYSEGFETYAAGSSITGQGGWAQWENAALGANDNAIVVAPEPVHTGTKAFANWLDSDAIQDWGVSQPGTYVSGKWRVGVWTYFPSSNTTEVQWWVFLSDYHNGCSNGTVPPACFWTGQAAFDPTVPEFFAQIGNSLCTGATQFQLSAPLVTDAWAEVVLEVDLDSSPQSAQLYYAGNPVGDPFDWEEGVSAGTLNGPIDTIDLYANNNAVLQKMYWDDLTIAASSAGNVPPCQGTATTYCTAGTSSSGCIPSINSIGVPSAAHTQGFQIGLAGGEGDKQGLFFFSTAAQPTALSWGPNSFLCVKSPFKRTPGQNSGGVAGQCNGAYSILWSGAGSWAQTTGFALNAGDTFYGQWWYRDPSIGGPKFTGMSDGITWIMAP